MIIRGLAVQLFFSLQIASPILPGHLAVSFTLHLHACCLFPDTLPPCLMFMHPFLTAPSDPSLQPSSTTLKVLSPWHSRMSSASPICLLLTTAIAVCGDQERVPYPESSWISSLQAVEVAAISSVGWSAYFSLGKPSREDSQPRWDGPGTRPRGNNGQRLLFWKGGNNLKFETDYLSSAF